MTVKNSDIITRFRKLKFTVIIDKKRKNRYFSSTLRLFKTLKIGKKLIRTASDEDTRFSLFYIIIIHARMRTRVLKGEKATTELFLWSLLL